MSDVTIEEQAPATKQKTLLSEDNVDYQIELDELKTYFVQEPSMNGVKMPRFGLYSVFARNIPMYAYDHPDLVKRCQTAFTDGQNIFFSTAFMEKILSDEKGGRNGMLFLTLHEVGHNLFRHFFRCLEYPGDIANRAQDMSMNTRMLRDFVKNPDQTMNSLYPLSPALECGVGFEPGDIEKYSHRSEEDIAQEMMNDYEDQMENLKNALSQMAQGQGQGSGAGSGMKMPGQGQGQGGKGGEGEGEEGMGTDHLISPDELAEIFNNAGLGHIVKILDLPVDANGKIDQAKLKKQSEAQINNAHNAHTHMENLRHAAGGRLPGAHSQDYAKQTLGKLSRPKISWRTSVKQMIVGNGMKVATSFDHPGDAYMIDPVNMGISNRLFIGSRIPAKPNGFTLALMDTSGSMTCDGNWMRESASEVLGLVSQNKNTASDVVFLQIDTVIRGKPMIITPANVDALLKEAFEARGLGGTSLTTGINMAMNSPEVIKRLKAGQKINGLLYFTDLGDASPRREDLPKNLPKKVLYLAVPGTYNDKFASDVADYATVVSMGERMTVDLTGDKPSVAGMRNSKPRGL